MNTLQFLVAQVASFGGLLFGYEIGVNNIVLVMDAFRIYFGFHSWDGSTFNENDNKIQMNNNSNSNNEMWYRNLKESKYKAMFEGVITSSFVLGALCGALMATYFGEKYGRQKTIFIGLCIFIASAVIQAISSRQWMVIAIGRLITGLFIGCNGVLCPKYISEMAPVRIRDTLSYGYQMTIPFGIILATNINSVIWYCTNVKSENFDVERTDGFKPINNLEWRLALVLQTIPGIVLAILMSFLPKSPRWLCSKNRDEEAMENLAKLNGVPTSNPVVLKELKAIQEDVAATRTADSSSSSELFSSEIRRRNFITFFMQSFKQWTGINVLMYSQYQSQIYRDIGFKKVLSTVFLPNINNLVNFVFILPVMWGIENLGRKHLLVIGTMMMIFHISTLFFTIQTHSGKVLQFLVSFFLFIFSFAWTWGSKPWIFQKEVSPFHVKVKGSTVGTVSNFLNNWIIAFVGLAMMKAWSMRSFLLPAVACLLAYLCSIFYATECKGLNLEEMNAKIGR